MVWLVHQYTDLHIFGVFGSLSDVCFDLLDFQRGAAKGQKGVDLGKMSFQSSEADQAGVQFNLCDGIYNL